MQGSIEKFIIIQTEMLLEKFYLNIKKKYHYKNNWNPNIEDYLKKRVNTYLKEELANFLHWKNIHQIKKETIEIKVYLLLIYLVYHDEFNIIFYCQWLTFSFFLTHWNRWLVNGIKIQFQLMRDLFYAEPDSHVGFRYEQDLLTGQRARPGMMSRVACPATAAFADRPG